MTKYKQTHQEKFWYISRKLRLQQATWREFIMKQAKDGISKPQSKYLFIYQNM